MASYYITCMCRACGMCPFVQLSHLDIYFGYSDFFATYRTKYGGEKLGLSISLAQRPAAWRAMPVWPGSLMSERIMVWVSNPVLPVCPPYHACTVQSLYSCCIICISYCTVCLVRDGPHGSDMKEFNNHQATRHSIRVTVHCSE